VLGEAICAEDEPLDDTTPLPTGTVTFLFTDIEGSTQLWEQYPESMRLALACHDALLRQAIHQHRGQTFKTGGDAFCVAFATPGDAIAAAVTAQSALHAQAWDKTGPLRVRMALHSGVAQQREGDFFGPALNRVARLLAAAHGGQILLSQATSDQVRNQLPEAASLRDLGAHRLKDLQQPEQIFQLVHPALPADFPPLRSLEASRHNLPAPLTSFIGRECEMAGAKRLLSATRLLTLTGSGGCGKTRLALQVAAELVEEYADGVWLVELAALADPGLVPQTVASALGVREEPGRALTATLTDHLRPRSLLLVLDNCEHLLSASAHLVESLLRACLHLRVLASSREPLGVSGEQTYRVPSLSLPDPRHLPALDQLQEYEAVRLFVERAGLSQPSFAVTETNAVAVAAVCHRLDGIPLAIELAAARVKALPVEKLNERLDNMFRLLTGGSRTALPRQQTLRALIDWSYDLLSPSERALLRRLSVFAGGWTLEAAEAVCVGEGVEEWEVLDVLTSLVEKSLVLYEERAEEGRYRLLETVRQYARDRLLEAGEVAGVRGRHRDWFLALADQADEELLGPADVEWLARLEREHDNLRAALAWSLEQASAVAGRTSGVSGPEGRAATDNVPLVAGLRLAGALRRFWAERCHWQEGREWLAKLLAFEASDVPRSAWAKALLAAGNLAFLQQEYERAVPLLEESGVLFHELGERRGIAASLRLLGWIACGRAQYQRATTLGEESLTLDRAEGNSSGIAASLYLLARVASERGEYERAVRLLEESLVLSRELGNKVRIAQTLEILCRLAVCQGEDERAAMLGEEALVLLRECGSTFYVAWALASLGRVAMRREEYERAVALCDESASLFPELRHRGIAYPICTLGKVAYYRGDYDRATALYQESLAMHREVESEGRSIWDDKWAMAEELEGLGAIAVARGRPERAARLLGAAEALREAISAPLPPAEHAEHDRSVAAVRTALGEEAFAAACAAGQAMSLEDAVALALDETCEG
jgi:predicted ATPase/class 3 adenylate cyclase